MQVVQKRFEIPSVPTGDIFTELKKNSPVKPPSSDNDAIMNNDSMVESTRVREAPVVLTVPPSLLAVPSSIVELFP